jgi:hypothetical protein
MQAQPKIIQSPYSGEYIKPRITKREDQDTIYTEAIYMCPSSGNFVQKIVLNTERKKKVVNEAVVEESIAGVLGGAKKVADIALGVLPYFNLASMGANIIKSTSHEDECDPNTDPDCEAIDEDEDLLGDDAVLDSSEGENFVDILKGIRSKVADVESGKLLISRNNLIDVLAEIDKDIEQILSSIKYTSDEAER